MQIDKIIAEVAAFYEVTVVAVAVQRSGGTELIASRGLQVTYLDWKQEGSFNERFDFFRHSVNRNLPIIIEDTAQDARVRGDSLVTMGPRIRFYASAPIGFTGIGQCACTLSIASATPRIFLLQNAEMLQRSAAEVGRLLSTSEDLSARSVLKLDCKEINFEGPAGRKST